MIKKIGIVGYGVIGKIMFDYFKMKYSTIFHDPHCSDAEYSASISEINRCDIAVICVPTASLSTGECDISIVEEVIKLLETPLILIKSTVAPGTTDRLMKETGKHIVFSPEYCGESTYVTGYNWDQDIKNEPFYVFGGALEDTEVAIDAFAQISGPSKVYYQCSALEAELVKYMENMYLATKVVFAYEMFEVCKAFGADYHKVRLGWLLDPRINPASTIAFKDNIHPYSGKCLPKDTKAIVQSSIKQGYYPKFFESVVDSNERIAKIRKRK